MAEDLNKIRLGNVGGAKQAMATLEASLRAEDWFFGKVREKLTETAPPQEFQLLQGASDHLLNFAQFLYFLRALDCTSPEHVSAFIEQHNAMIESKLADPANAKKSGELKKAFFGPVRKRKIENSIKALNQPVFAISEYGHLLIEQMSPKTTENLIEDLRVGRLLVEVKDNSINADQRRILYASTGFLEENYERSLLVQRRLIADTLDETEIARINAT